MFILLLFTPYLLWLMIQYDIIRMMILWVNKKYIHFSDIFSLKKEIKESIYSQLRGHSNNYSEANVRYDQSLSEWNSMK